MLQAKSHQLPLLRKNLILPKAGSFAKSRSNPDKQSIMPVRKSYGIRTLGP